MDPADIRRFATLVTEFKSRVKSPAADGQRVEHSAQG
jgi:hypothetical protein